MDLIITLPKGKVLKERCRHGKEVSSGEELSFDYRRGVASTAAGTPEEINWTNLVHHQLDRSNTSSIG